jgi:hypothetical protein
VIDEKLNLTVGKSSNWIVLVSVSLMHPISVIKKYLTSYLPAVSNLNLKLAE